MQISDSNKKCICLCNGTPQVASSFDQTINYYLSLLQSNSQLNFTPLIKVADFVPNPMPNSEFNSYQNAIISSKQAYLDHIPSKNAGFNALKLPPQNVSDLELSIQNDKTATDDTISQFFSPFDSDNEKLPVLDLDLERENNTESKMSVRSKKINKKTLLETNSPGKTANSVIIQAKKGGNKDKKDFWKPHEDAQVLELVAKHGKKWTLIGKMIGGRTGKQVRDRYLNSLRSDIKNVAWTEEEDKLFVSLYKQIGNKWCQIAKKLPGRTENQVKNRFHTHIKHIISSCSDKSSTSSSSTELSPVVNTNEYYENYQNKKQSQQELNALKAGESPQEPKNTELSENLFEWDIDSFFNKDDFRPINYDIVYTSINSKDNEFYDDFLMDFSQL